jgi:hypothetical protein
MLWTLSSTRRRSSYLEMLFLAILMVDAVATTLAGQPDANLWSTSRSGKSSNHVEAVNCRGHDCIEQTCAQDDWKKI